MDNDGRRRRRIYSAIGGAGAAAPGPSVGDGLLQEDGTSFVLIETGDFLLLE